MLSAMGIGDLRSSTDAPSLDVDVVARRGIKQKTLPSDQAAPYFNFS